jgi:hypothetical protein
MTLLLLLPLLLLLLLLLHSLRRQQQQQQQSWPGPLLQHQWPPLQRPWQQTAAAAP